MFDPSHTPPPNSASATTTTSTTNPSPHPLQNTGYFDPDPSWLALSHRLGYNAHPSTPSAPIKPLDIPSDREAQLISEGEWTTSHPLAATTGYTATLHTTPSSRDGFPLELKVYRPARLPPTQPLPTIFVTHGGGWIQGTHVTEEAWLLWPVFNGTRDVCVVSVAYRLAPEAAFPTLLEDCWDALAAVVLGGRAVDFGVDPDRVVVAGSSAGACLAAVLAQMARDADADAESGVRGKMKVKGVVLNVPITCDPRRFPTGEYEYTSYEQCRGTLLSGGEMRQVWEVVVPSSSPLLEDGVGLSPLLGDVSGLPPHVVYVAGQDPLRDEGIAYAKKLEAAGVAVTLRVYPGVPHTFGEFWELEPTRGWWGHVTEDLDALLRD